MTENKHRSPSEKMRSALPDEPHERRPNPLLLVLTGALSLALVLACCVCGIGAWWFRPQLIDNPVHAEQVLGEIVDIQIPETFHPRGTIEWNVAFVLSLRGVYFERFVGDGTLVLLEVKGDMTQEDHLRRHIRRTLLEEGSGGSQLVVDKTKTFAENFEIRGQSVPFTFEIARNPQTNRTYHIVDGVFEGKSGQVLLTLRVDDEHWNDEPDSPSSEGEARSQKIPRWVEAMLASLGRSPADRGDVPADPTPAGAPAEPNPTPATGNS